MAATRPPLTVRITRRLPLPRERVFRAFVEAEAIEVWFAGPKLRWTEPPRLDPRPGGAYRFTVTDGEKRWCIFGTYREVVPPERLVFTWQWEDDPLQHDSADTLVTVEFLVREGGTEVVLTHDGLPNETHRQDHEKGWAEVLDHIERLLESS
jgi:uncharacterized protein YndB with AHSA1/START domain